MTLVSDFVAGQKLRASDLLIPPRGIIARGQRTTVSTGTTATTQGTAQGVLRLTGVTMYSGRLYRVATPAIGVLSSVSVDRVTVGLTYTTDGSTPAVGSTRLHFGNVEVVGVGVVHSLHVEGYYVPSSNLTFGVLASVYRQSGTGSVQTYGASDWPFNLIVEDLGVDVGDTGVDI